MSTFLTETIRRGPDRNLTYIVAHGGEAACVDPGADIAPCRAALARLGARLVAILITHGHGDHVEGALPLARATGAPVLAAEATARAIERAGARVSRVLADGDRVLVGDAAIEVLATPGHHPGAVCFLLPGEAIITGDTLFIGDSGRADLPGGSARALWESLARLKALPDALLVLPGHDYGPVPSRTLGEEKRLSKVLLAPTFEAFEAIP